MTDLIRGYGRGLVAVFVAAVLGWGLMLIVLPQLTMLERAVTPPKRALDSSVAAALERDARTCINVLKTYEKPADAAPVSNGGLAIPSPGGMAVPSASAMAVPSPGGMAIPSMGGTKAGAARPYILQCDRSDTHMSMVRPAGQTEWLDQLYDLPRMKVSDTAPIARQIETAQKIATLASGLRGELEHREASESQLTLANFRTLTAPTMIPLSPDQKAVEDAKLSNKLFELVGLRYQQDGHVYKRLGLITLARTLAFAVAATLLALVLCYPVAYKVALATPPDRAKWLFLGLVIPYAIVELMRIYAWTAIIDNQGLLNSLLMWIGAISDPIQFKRMAGTIFVVIVYTYVLFMVFPIFNVMSTLDRNQIEAAKDLGAKPWRVHWRVIMPHAKPGIAVGCIATFMLSAGAFSVPRIISRGLQAEWFSQTIYNKFFESQNTNTGAAYSFAFTLVCFAVVGLFMWLMRTRLKDFARVQ
ncbi:ABC transporter permease [Acidimangrovimonas pyrenivorans]|uniref:ABC transporter permease n=1 Tax=Acidimangrovimonas pyrenivorans TaxID=2030798 RepID=A0ABV7AGB8_9RHOB